MTNETETETVFGGTDPSAGTYVPRWYRSTRDVRQGASVEFPSFRDVVEQMSDDYGAETTPCYYYDDERDEYVEIPDRAALVNPEWVGAEPSEYDRGSAAWTTVSDDYAPVEAIDAYGPLVAVARRRGLESAFGTVETYRHGGDFVAEILFEELRVELDGTEFVLGFETGYDHFRRSSVWACLLAYDTSTGAALRGLSERYTSSHRGEDATHDMADWFDGMFDRADRLGDTLTNVVAEAREYDVELADMPLSVAEFYEALGAPTSYANTAAERISNVRDPSAFELYLALAETVTTEFDGKTGGSAVRKHATTANGLLYAPASSEKRALEAARDELREQGQGTLAENYDSAADQLTDRIDTLGDGVEAFETVRDRIRTMINDLDAEDGGEETEGVEA